MVESDVINAIREVLEDSSIHIDIEPNMELRDLMDSMSILEVILILEQENNYETKFIRIDEVVTVQDLIRQVEEHRG